MAPRTDFFAVEEDQTLYFNQDVNLNIDLVIVRAELAKEIIEQKRNKEQEEIKKIEEVKGEKKDEHVNEISFHPAVSSQKAGVKHLTIKAKIQWDKLSSVLQGVIKPLQDKGHVSYVMIEIKAQAREEFDRNTLDIKVKETLKQIGSEIENWDECES